MTLITGFKCMDGILLCADSQETIGEHRVARLKIEPFKLGSRFEIAMGGSGDGDALDAFVQSLKDEWPANEPIDVNGLGLYIRMRLKDYRATELPLLPRDERGIKFLIAVRCSDPEAIAIWETKAARLIPVDSYALTGHDYTVYERAIQRHYAKDICISRAIPLAMYVFNLAEETSNYIRFPVTAIAVTIGSPIYKEYDWAIQHFREKTTIFTAQLERMLLACADATISSPDFERQFKEFSDTIIQLRKDYFREAADLEIKGFFSGKWPNDPFRRLPRGTSVSFGSSGTIAIENDQEAKAKVQEAIQQHDAFMDGLRSKGRQSIP